MNAMVVILSLIAVAHVLWWSHRRAKEVAFSRGWRAMDLCRPRKGRGWFYVYGILTRREPPQWREIIWALRMIRTNDVTLKVIPWRTLPRYPMLVSQRSRLPERRFRDDTLDAIDLAHRLIMDEMNGAGRNPPLEGKA